jgi:hypothetical protein
VVSSSGLSSCRTGFKLGSFRLARFSSCLRFLSTSRARLAKLMRFLAIRTSCKKARLGDAIYQQCLRQPRSNGRGQRTVGDPKSPLIFP